jgi:DNA primase
MGLPHEPSRPFNVGAIQRAGDVIHVTEGEIDAMTLTQVGFHAIGLPGATNWSNVYRRLLAGFSRVWVWGDPDEAGAGMVSKVSRALSTAKGVRLKDGDVNETYIKFGAEGLQRLIEDSSSV